MSTANGINATTPKVGKVEELAKKKGVKMARIAVSWSLKRVTAPVVGTTMANFRTRRRQLALDVELTEEEAKYLEES